MTQPPTDAERIASIREVIRAANGDWHEATSLWSIGDDLTWLLARAAEGAAGPARIAELPESIASVLGSPELPPLPWTSPALLQPWPNSAADADEIRDANGRAITSRNWRETAHALMLVVLAVNHVHRQSLVAPAPPAVRDRIDVATNLLELLRDHIEGFHGECHCVRKLDEFLP